LDMPLHVETWSLLGYVETGMTVTLHNCYASSQPVESFLIDCAPSTPVVLSSNIYAGDHQGFHYDGNGGAASVRLGNGMTLVVTDLGAEVWDGLTHKGVWWVETYRFDPPASVWLNPADPMTAAIVGWRYTDITVSPEGGITTAHHPTPSYSTSETYVANGNKRDAWRLACGSPYLPNPVALCEVEVDAGSYQHWNPYSHTYYTQGMSNQVEGLLDYTVGAHPEPALTGQIQTSNVPLTGGSAYTNETGPMTRLSGGRFVCYQEIGSYLDDGIPQANGDVYGGRFLAADPVTGVVEYIPLPYDPSFFPGGPYGSPDWDTPVSLSNGSMGIGADEATGQIVVGTTLVGWHRGEGDMFCMQVWSIQGPGGAKPNLTGGPIGVDVRFVT